MQVKFPQLDGVRVNSDGTLPYQILQAIKKAYEYIELIGNQTSSTGVTLIEDLHANRNILHPATALPIGSIYLETDRNLLYIVELVLEQNTWVFLEGTYVRLQAQLAALAATLGTNDTNLLVKVSDYSHVLRWSGTAWGWGPGDAGSGMLAPFIVAPSASGWHVCDGSSVAYLKPDGTTANVTLPNTSGSPAYMLNGASYASAVTAAVLPVATGSLFTGDPLTPIGTISAIAATATAAITISVAGAIQVAAQTHTHPAPTFTGIADTPTGTITDPTVTLPGDPVANFTAVLYFRQ